MENGTCAGGAVVWLGLGWGIGGVGGVEMENRGGRTGWSWQKGGAELVKGASYGGDEVKGMGEGGERGG